MYGNLHVSAPQTTDNAIVWLGAPEGTRFFAAEALDPTELRRFRERRSTRRREEFAVSRALISHAHCAALPSESLSHSAGHAALLQARAGVSVGIDLEVHRPRDFLAIARATFASAETEALGRLSGSRREEAFYALWTLKEALAKALQLNLLNALRECEFEIADDRWSGCAPGRGGSFSVFRPRPDFTLAAVCIGDSCAGALRTMEWPMAMQRPWPQVTAGVLIPSGARPRPACP
jgi:4'-phosphopantetheinyl transferase superfamily